MDLWLIQDSTTGSLLDMSMTSFSNDGKATAYQSYANMCYSVSFNFDTLIQKFPRFLIDCIVVTGEVPLNQICMK